MSGGRSSCDKSEEIRRNDGLGGAPASRLRSWAHSHPWYRFGRDLLRSRLRACSRRCRALAPSRTVRSSSAAVAVAATRSSRGRAVLEELPSSCGGGGRPQPHLWRHPLAVRQSARARGRAESRIADVRQLPATSPSPPDPTFRRAGVRARDAAVECAGRPGAPRLCDGCSGPS